MIVRSTQLRPSQQTRGADRAVAFANTASRRSASLDAAAQKSTTTPIRNAMVIPNPNRTTRRWGTVQIKETESMRDARELHVSAIRAAREAHPGENRVTPTGSERLAPQRTTQRTTQRTAVRTTSASTATAEVRTQREIVRSNVVAMYPGTRSVSEKRTSAAVRSTVSVSVTAGASGRVAGARGASVQRAAKSHGTLHVATSAPSEDFVTAGATALAPISLDARKSPVRRAKPDLKTANLRVARPARRVARRTIARPASAVFAIMLLVAGAVSAIVMHADLAKNQLVLDKVRVAVGTEERTNQRLRVEVAELEAPARVITAANQIGLVSAERVDYTAISVSAPSK
jgi:cell division protein FtsL